MTENDIISICKELAVTIELPYTVIYNAVALPFFSGREVNSIFVQEAYEMSLFSPSANGTIRHTLSSAPAIFKNVRTLRYKDKNSFISCPVGTFISVPQGAYVLGVYRGAGDYYRILKHDGGVYSVTGFAINGNGEMRRCQAHTAVSEDEAYRRAVAMTKANIKKRCAVCSIKSHKSH